MYYWNSHMTHLFKKPVSAYVIVLSEPEEAKGETRYLRLLKLKWSHLNVWQLIFIWTLLFPGPTSTWSLLGCAWGFLLTVRHSSIFSAPCPFKCISVRPANKSLTLLYSCYRLWVSKANFSVDRNWVKYTADSLLNKKMAVVWAWFSRLQTKLKLVKTYFMD